jgi:protein gp37
MNKTSIEWTHRPETGGSSGGFTWNPIRARRTIGNGKVLTGTFCTHASPGCTNCYAAAINKRFGTGMDYVAQNLKHHEFYVDQKILSEPAKRKKPATIFVGDMFDLFHEAISDEFILDVWDVMNQCRQHTFQVLTKRVERMADFVSRLHLVFGGERDYFTLVGPDSVNCGYMLSNVWAGASVEDQQRANERIPYLLATPAKVRFLSVEPQLEEVNLRDAFIVGPEGGIDFAYTKRQMIHQVICGGESGPGARPYRTEWALSIVNQCKDAGVACFVKQLGSHVMQDGVRRRKADRKGGDMSEWPHELRVREFPA